MTCLYQNVKELWLLHKKGLKKIRDLKVRGNDSIGVGYFIRINIDTRQIVNH